MIVQAASMPSGADLVNRAGSAPASVSAPKDSFQNSEPVPTYKKAVNAAVWGVAGAVAGAVLTVAIGGALVSGPDALGVFLFAPIGGAVGAALSAVAGWKWMNR